jgi:hypothetical protein
MYSLALPTLSIDPVVVSVGVVNLVAAVLEYNA